MPSGSSSAWSSTSGRTTSAPSARSRRSGPCERGRESTETGRRASSTGSRRRRSPEATSRRLDRKKFRIADRPVVSSLATEEKTVIPSPLPRLVAGLGPDDGELLRRFLATRDDAAFEVLVWRHGATVLGACRRVLGAGPDADDAFQAPFLTLARTAATVRRAAGLPAWLHRVATRIAYRVRANRARRWTRERPADREPTAPAVEPGDDRAAVLDAEID